MELDLLSTLPALVAHADWSIHPRKRWMARATLRDGVYTASAPEQVTNAGSLLVDLQTEFATRGPVLVGFDFPIGLPAAYAGRAGISKFLSWLPQMGTGQWSNFANVAKLPREISLSRPFYPNAPGGTSQRYLLNALGVEAIDELRRVCERRHAMAKAASPLFWTMGPNQVGKAALNGWIEVLIPALRDGAVDATIWPFAGDLPSLLSTHRVVIVETYPGEMYHHIGVT